MIVLVRFEIIVVSAADRSTHKALQDDTTTLVIRCFKHLNTYEIFGDFHVRCNLIDYYIYLDLRLWIHRIAESLSNSLYTHGTDGLLDFNEYLPSCSHASWPLQQYISFKQDVLPNRNQRRGLIHLFTMQL